MSYNLTSAGVVAWLRADKTFPVGFPLSGFADGDALSSSQSQIAEMYMGVDGEAGVAVFPSPKTLTVTLMPGTPAAKNLMLLASAMENGIKTDASFDEITVSITLPAQGYSVTLSGGIMTEYPPLPNVKQRLENVQFGFKFAKAKFTQL